ncbi:MAG: hypothetical protein LKE86_08380 [Eubacterium sp.]|jgi:hypothetical protein|nr:hypothetical protein [Eubacterium sp.]MCH4047423.1 hypothetical protein [Eubacterium sp.]
MTRTKSSRALLSVVLAVLMAAAFMPSLTYSSFAATAKKATKVTKVTHADKAKFTRTVGTAWTLKYKLSPSKLTSAAKKVVWKSSNSKVAKITTIKSGKAVVSFKSTGSASVTVYTKANKKAKTTWNFKVVEKKAAAQKVAATGVTVAANNSTDYTKTLTAGTTLTATVAPANATGVTYQWYADDQPISGATKQEFKVTTDQIGKAITVKATDDSKNTVASTASAKVSDVTLTGVQLQSNTGKDGAYEAAGSSVVVGTTLKVAGSTLTGASKVSDVAAVKWIRTIKSANGTAQDTTVAENTDTYTVTKADLAAKQQGATVTIKAEVTPNTGVKAYGTTNSKFTAGPVNVSGEFAVSIQANGKDVTNVKAGTKLTAVVTPSDVKVTYQWYKDGKQIAGATSAEYTPTEDGTYRVHVAVAADETTFDKTTHKDATVKVGGKTIEKVVVNSNYTDKLSATKDSVLTAYPQWTHTAEGTTQAEMNKHVTYQWYRNGVALKDATAQTLDLSKLTPAATTADSFYCVVTGKDDFLSDPVTSNTVKVVSLGEITTDGVTAELYGKTVYATGLDLSKYNVQVVTVTKNDKDVFASENVVDSTLNNHATKDADGTYSAADRLDDLTSTEASNLYLKLTGTNGYTGTKYVQVNAADANKNAITATEAKDSKSITVNIPDGILKNAKTVTYQWMFANKGTSSFANCSEKTATEATLTASDHFTSGGYYVCVVTIDGTSYASSVVTAK